MILNDKVLVNRDQFLSKVEWISGALGIDSNWLMAVMWFESKLNPQAANPYGTAVGLIQFTKSTALSLGTTRQELLLMSNVEQLKYVYKYLLPYKGKLNSPGQLYLAIFSPAYLNKADDYIISLSANWVKANKIFDLNQDENITVGEVRTKFIKYYEHLKSLYPAAVSGSLLLIGFAIALLTIKL